MGNQEGCVLVSSVLEADCKEKYEEFDLDKNGVLDQTELTKFLATQDQILRTFSKIIMKIYGSDGLISFKQFEKFYKNCSTISDPLNKEYIANKIFKYIDTDDSQEIDKSELLQVISDFDLPPGIKLPIDKYEKLNYEQFLDFFNITIKNIWDDYIGTHPEAINT